VDDTREPTAVPTRFRDFHMSWLSGGAVSPEFARPLAAAKKPS